MKQIKLSFKRIGNHWYPNINHEENYPIGLTSKLDKYMSVLNNKLQLFNKVTILFKELDFIDGKNILYFDDRDITRFMTTDDNFLIKFRIDDKYFELSSDLYHLLENLYDFDFSNSVYNVSVISNY